MRFPPVPCCDWNRRAIASERPAIAARGVAYTRPRERTHRRGGATTACRPRSATPTYVGLDEAIALLGVKRRASKLGERAGLLRRRVCGLGRLRRLRCGAQPAVRTRHGMAAGTSAHPDGQKLAPSPIVSASATRIAHLRGGKATTIAAWVSGAPGSDPVEDSTMPTTGHRKCRPERDRSQNEARCPRGACVGL
jgi:hypothetical protein